MQVAQNKVVSIDYTLKDDDGSVLDSSEGGEPLVYLHGAQNIIPGLEAALEGKAVGDGVQTSIPPEEGYGAKREELLQVVERKHFADTPELEIGMRFQVTTEDDNQVIVSVTKIDQDTVTLDANHELAGMTLHFDVTIREIRDATPEEIEHRHVH